MEGQLNAETVPTAFITVISFDPHTNVVTGDRCYCYCSCLIGKEFRCSERFFYTKPYNLSTVEYLISGLLELELSLPSYTYVISRTDLDAIRFESKYSRYYRYFLVPRKLYGNNSL